MLNTFFHFISPVGGGGGYSKPSPACLTKMIFDKNETPCCGTSVAVDFLVDAMR